MRFVSRFVSRIRACVGVRARIGARVGVGWGAMAPVLLSAGACPGFYVYTAYTNTFTTYRLLLTAYTNRCAIYCSRRWNAFTSHALPLTQVWFVYLLRLSAYVCFLCLSSIWCFLPLGVSLLVLLYPSARLENRIISWYFAHLCRSSPYSCFALRLRAFRRWCGTCLYLCRLERLYWLYLRPLGTFYVQG